jgi:hypothetical protein
LKALLIIVRHPVNVLSHPRAWFILGQVGRVQFRLHWLRDVARAHG